MAVANPALKSCRIHIDNISTSIIVHLFNSFVDNSLAPKSNVFRLPFQGISMDDGE